MKSLQNESVGSVRNSTHHSSAILIYAACAALILIVNHTAAAQYANKMVSTKEFTKDALTISAEHVAEVVVQSQFDCRMATMPKPNWIHHWIIPVPPASSRRHLIR